MSLSSLFHAIRISAMTVVVSGLVGGSAMGQPRPDERPLVLGVAALDVYGHGETIDVLFVNSDGQAKTLHHKRSATGGRTWGPVNDIDVGDTPIGVASRGNGPQIVAHENRIAVYWSTEGVDRFGSGPMVTMYSVDGGRTWLSGPNPAEDGTRRGQNFADMAADPDGTFYVAWIGSHDGPAGRALGVARSTDFGVTWEFSQLADPSACACCWNRIDAPAPGVARVLYRDHGIRNMAQAATADSGRSWLLGGTVGNFGWDFDGCPHVGGGIATGGDGDAEHLHALVWTGHQSQHGLYWVSSVDQGTSWSTPLRFGGDFARHGDIGTNGQTVVATWDESRAIWVSVSQDAGLTWSTDKQLSAEEMVATHPIVVRTDAEFIVFWTARNAEGLVDWHSHRLETTTLPPTADGQLP